MQPNQNRDVRLEKLAKLKALGVEPWPRKAQRTHGIAELAAAYADAETWTNEKLEGLGLTVSVMGRVLTIREMGIVQSSVGSCHFQGPG